MILFALQVCDICRSNRGLVVRVTCVQSRLYILYYRCGDEHLALYLQVIFCHIYIISLPLFIQWVQFIYDISTVCLHFTCEFERIELPAKLLDYFLRSNQSNINQHQSINVLCGAAGLSAQWPCASVMLVMPIFLFLSAPQ